MLGLAVYGLRLMVYSPVDPQSHLPHTSLRSGGQPGVMCRHMQSVKQGQHSLAEQVFASAGTVF